jgi:hypothetical protein
VSRALRHPSFAAGAVLVALLVGAALLSLAWSPYPPADIDIAGKLAPPSAAHWLGTDSLGRDIASQLLAGSQNSIAVGVLAVGIGLGVGVVLGCMAAARGGWVEELVMRAADFTFAFPGAAHRDHAHRDPRARGWPPASRPSASSTSRCSRAWRARRRMRSGRATTCWPPAPPARGRGASRSTMCCPTSPTC